MFQKKKNVKTFLDITSPQTPTNCHCSPKNRCSQELDNSPKRLRRVCEEFQMKREGLEWFEKCNYLNSSVALIMHRQRAAHQRTSARLCP